MNTKVVKLKEYTNDGIGLFIQVILTELLIIFGIICLISNIFLPVFYAILTMLMFTLSYNNNKFYKKKYMTIVYILFGIFILVTTLLEYIG